MKPILVNWLCIIAACIGSGCAATQKPTASSVVWPDSEVFVLPPEAGFQLERLELKDGRFRYWFSSDVIHPNPPKYPIEGAYEFKGDQLVLSSGKTYTVRTLQGTRTLWRPVAVDYWDHYQIIDVYGILQRVDRKQSGKITLEPLFTKEQWEHSREQVRQLERKK